MLDINQSYIVKTKECFVETRNKKDTITRTKKTKTKFIKKDFFDFKYVDATIKISRDSKRAIRKNNNRNKTRQKKQKKLKIDIVVAININI